MNISNLSVVELKQLLAQIPKEIERREKEEKAKLRKELEAKAAEFGFTLSELVAETPFQKQKIAVSAKYRSPSNPDLTWSGRGRQPKWVIEFVEKGGSLGQLKI